MKNIEIYIQTNKKIIEDSYVYNTDNCTYKTVEDLKVQAKFLNIDYSITKGPSSEIPRKVDSFLFIILEENSLIPDDYLSRILSMNNLHRDMSCMFGPRLTRSSRIVLELAGFLDFYYNYNLDSFSTFISCYINSQEWLYPPITGCVFSGRSYNSVGGYQELKTPRHTTEENPDFFSRVDKSGKMIYSDRLTTYKFITHEDLENANIMKWCYSKGFTEELIKHKSYLNVLLRKDGLENLLAAYELGRIEQKTSTKIFDF